MMRSTAATATPGRTRINALPCGARERGGFLLSRSIRPAAAARPPPGSDRTRNARFHV